MLNLNIGERREIDGRVFIDTKHGRYGNAIYGPYIEVEPGEYEVIFSIEALNPIPGHLDRRCAVADVVTEYGHLTYARKELTVGDLAGRPSLVPLSFSVRERATLEFRILARGEASLRIAEDVALHRRGEVQAPSPVQSAFPDPAVTPRPTVFMENLAGFREMYERGADIEIDGLTVHAKVGDRRVNAGHGNLLKVGADLWPQGRYLNVRYAQALEDVILLHALEGVSRDDGFYIDVGANDPTEASVTKIFYDRGWQGINIDASPKWHAALMAERVRDINIFAAVSDAPGELTFYDQPEGALGTLSPEFAARHGIESGAITVPALTLASICEKHANRPIHFLKIDVEGHEGSVLRGMDFTRYRPWILCIEATEPNDITAGTFPEWDPIVSDAGYRLAYTDLLNRYYVAAERPELMAKFATSPSGHISWEELEALRRASVS